MKQSLNPHRVLIIGGLILTAGAIAYFTCGPSADASLAAEDVAARDAITQFLRQGNAELHRVKTALAGNDLAVQRLSRSPAAGQIPLADLGGNPFHHPSPELADVQTDDRMTLLKSVHNLRLESILQSENAPACMINGSLYREGESLGKFAVDTISDSSVVVRSGEYRFELKVRQ